MESELGCFSIDCNNAYTVMFASMCSAIRAREVDIQSIFGSHTDVAFDYRCHKVEFLIIHSSKYASGK